MPREAPDELSPLSPGGSFAQGNAMVLAGRQSQQLRCRHNMDPAVWMQAREGESDMSITVESSIL